ncbi:MAG TPA: type I DNA topoisomerase, partial [Chloroflexota bacterium]|nr:type I DNA topoisomerase [Chloroflexota bacterium]
VIVESPTKARTVGRFLGRDYVVEASIGHIRDLPANRLGVDVAHGFAPHYVIPEKKKDIVKKLKSEAREAEDIYLATDPDREGEAISWHLAEALNLKDSEKIHRVEFHEITKEAILRAFAAPRSINTHLVEAQQARRILDRLVGYNLSPLLRRKISKRGLSAGRVQSVAVRLVVDREREIEAFVPVEYWTIDVELSKLRGSGRGRARTFVASLAQVNGNKPDLVNEEAAKSVVEGLERSSFEVADVRQREINRQPAAPFTTSTLQQEASRKLGFSAKRTMAVAQQLYEGVEVGVEGNVGLITYMRTDSTNIAASAQQQTLDFIRRTYGPDYVPASPRVFKTKAKGAQEAHEAIRPTSVDRVPDTIKGYLSQDQYRLYKLIWQRMVASQMAAAVYDSVTVDIVAGPAPADRPYLLRATGSTLKFKGFTAVYTEGHDEGDETEDEKQHPLPPLQVGEPLKREKIVPEQHFTQPPPRYTEATLVKALEENGVGRPSTYAPTLSTIQERGYVERSGRQLIPTALGKLVTDLLAEHFPDIIDVKFTAGMEERLDDIASQGEPWVRVLEAFYGPFESTMRQAEHAIPEVSIEPEPAGELCEKCGMPMVIKFGRFGKFIACSNYPTCRNAKSFMVKVGVKCPQCGQGDLVEKRTRRGRLFYSCSEYPTCDFAIWQRPLPTPCPQCGGLLTEAGKTEAKCQRCGTTVSRTDVVAEEAVAAGSH